MERRTFLGALTGTSLGVLWKDSFAEFAEEQNTGQAGARVAAQGPFETLKSRFQETRYSCAAMERDRPF